MKRRYLKLVKFTLRSLRHPHLRDRRWWQMLTKPISNRILWIPCRDTVANGLAIGLFFAMMPMPFQMVPSAILAIRAKANVPFAVAACWITNPVTIPFFVVAQYCLGKWLRYSACVPIPKFLDVMSDDIKGIGQINLASYFLGVFTSGVLMALLAYPLAYFFSAIMPHHLPVRRSKAKSTPSP